MPDGKRMLPEHYVLDPGLQVALAACGDLDGPLADEPQQHRDFVRTQTPQRVLVRAHDPEVLPVPVEVVDLSEFTRVDHPLYPLQAGVIDGAGGRPSPRDRDASPNLGELAGVRSGQGQRLLDKGVLAGLQGPLGERRVGRHRRRDHDPVEGVVLEQVVVARGELRGRVRVPVTVKHLGVEITQPGEVGVGEPGELRARFGPQ